MKTELARMTWKEAERAVSERPVALLPVGSLEQNGPQSPLGSDTLLAEYFARQVAEHTNSVVLPGIAYGRSQAFDGFAGTISLRADTILGLVTDILSGAVRHGFRHVLVVNNHAPNEALIEAAIRDVRAQRGGVFAIVRPSDVLFELAVDVAGWDKSRGGHGGEVTTAAMLAICPDAVRMDLAVEDRPSAVGPFQVEASTRTRFQGYRLNLCLDMDRLSRTGVTGNPTRAQPDAIRPILAQLIQWGTELVAAFRMLEERWGGTR